MSSFTAPLRAEDSANGEKRTLLERFIFYVGVNQALFSIEVPVGFVTDGASIPRIFWWIVSPWIGTYAKAAVLHDFLYKSGIVSRLMADTIFLEAMLVAHTNKIKANVMFLAVRCFGRIAWNNHRKKDNK